MTLRPEFMMSKAGVMGRRWMALLTKIGRVYMKRRDWAHMIVSGTFILALGACVHKQDKPLEIDSPMGQVSPFAQQGALLQEARSESENLRAELGALKILMAKQAGELRSYREKSQSIYTREQDQGVQLQQIRSELLSSQAERDQLRKHNMELEGQVASMPDTAQLVSDIQSLTSSFQHIMASMKQLTSDMMLIKREMHISTSKATPQQTKLSAPGPQPSTRGSRTPDSHGRIVIQNGDTLWKISQEYDVSVSQLKEWNALTSDLIMTGIRMRVTTPVSPKPVEVNTPVESPASSISTESVNVPVHESLPAQDNRVEKTSEPKNILSLGSPNSTSHESP
jgi:LysM repeat protein